MYNKEKADLETIINVFKLLQCDDQDLNEEEAHRRLEIFGPNKLGSEGQNVFLQVSRPPASCQPQKLSLAAKFRAFDFLRIEEQTTEWHFCRLSSCHNFCCTLPALR